MTPGDILAAAERLRAAMDQPFPMEHAAAALGEACAQVASTATQAGAETVRAIAQRWGWSEEILELSLRALCEPVKRAALEALARKIRPRKELLSFIMAGNIPGAGLHEVILALLAGRAMIIKTASNEPIFFREFAAALAAIAPEMAARMAVLTWERGDESSTAALRQTSDRMVVFGDDATIRHPSLSCAANQSKAGQSTGFGSRVSGVVLTAASIAGSRRGRILHPLTLDVIAFEQRGCLSPHHVFVEDCDGFAAEDFAAALASQLDAYTADVMPPPSRLAMEDAAAIRRARERARWRAIGGEAVRLWEGPIPGWTVIYDRDASFSLSPGFRTVCVSPFSDATDLERRLAPVAGRIEGMAFKLEPTMESGEYSEGLRRALEQSGASYICEPGRMQSPPLDWPHGGGSFLRSLYETT